MAYTMASVMAGKKGRKLKPADFLLRWGGRGKRQSPDQILSVFKALATRQAAAKKENRVHHR